MDEYEIRSTLVKRITVHHRVFAESKAQAIDLVIQGKAERVDREERFLDKPTYSAKRK